MVELAGESLEHAGVGRRVDAGYREGGRSVTHKGAASRMVIAGGMVPHDDEVVPALPTTDRR